MPSDLTPLAGRARWAVVALVAVIATDVLAICSDWLEIDLLRWFHAAYRNLNALGQSDLRFTTGWAIGAWFVPFLNLWRPKQIANDIWTGSGTDTPALHGAGWKDRQLPALLGFWWAAWIISIYVDNIGLRTLLNTDTAEEIRTADWSTSRRWS